MPHLCCYASYLCNWHAHNIPIDFAHVLSSNILPLHDFDGSCRISTYEVNQNHTVYCSIVLQRILDQKARVSNFLSSIIVCVPCDQVIRSYFIFSFNLNQPHKLPGQELHSLLHIFSINSLLLLRHN